MTEPVSLGFDWTSQDKTEFAQLVKDILSGNRAGIEADMQFFESQFGVSGSSSSSSYHSDSYYSGKSYTDTSGQPVGKTSNAASLAEKYLGWGEPQLQADGVDGAAPYGESCADFVSSMLQKSGLINWHTDSVLDLATQLPAQGWKRVPLADAKPGDVWICYSPNGEQHTEIVASNINGKVTLIGSNNVSSGMQQISYDSYSASIPGSYILTPP